MLKRKSLLIPAIVVVLLIAFRIVLPYIVKDYVNKSLDELPGYNGHVNDIDIHLYRGAYTIKGLELIEEKGNPKYPFLKIPRTDLSIEWKSLFKGELVGEVVMGSPRMNILSAPATKEAIKQTNQEDWTKVVKDLMPITINRFVVNNGYLAYLDFKASPDVNMHIENMQLVALNLANVEKQQKALPSPATITGNSIGGGKLRVNMQGNFLKEIPDMDIKMELTQVDLTKLNDFIKAYGKFDVERGRLDMYGKVSIRNGQVDGYMKPFFENLKILNWKKDKKEGGILSAAKEAVIGLFAEAAENQKRDRIATQVPISGSITAMDTDNWKTFVNVLRNAFIEAFNKGIQDESGLGSSGHNKKDNDKKEKKKDKKKD
ncbi:DUF748 domain-containing protein [Pontibacter burrus]|uniref:DUF748 domain-containing protein n=1 Tax=Pontibacter burrus TaxID=2704466 RepID=A0A6B3LRL8_9BACT|nr:DUF748 domain-containing protein [Pontibacter burrus]NEM96110.1 DUF748 domain-containing protein [Pontibacter burrus]